MRTYHYKHIVKIDETGLTYVDETDTSCVINFDVCKQEWYKLQSKSYKRLIPIEACKTVGERDMTHDPAYIVFFDVEPIKFYFPKRRTWIHKLFHIPYHHQAFLQVQFQINEVGYQTYDLS